MRLVVCATIVVALTRCVLVHAQEVKYIDLRGVSQRIQLRYPPSECTSSATCVPGGAVGAGIGDGAPDPHDPHALGIFLESVYPTTINPAEPFEAEFKVLNTGLAPIQIPVWPHLADLQSSDSAPLEYSSISLVVQASATPNGPDVASYAYVELYGATDHEGTLVELKPGQWIRVKANLKLVKWPSQAVDARFRGQFWLRKNIFRPHAGGFSTNARNVYPNESPTPWITVHLLAPATRKPNE